jgi:SAM-dependent methyltransferase
MQLPEGTPLVIDFECNICGQANQWPLNESHREIASCEGCGSTPRFRGLMMALSERLYRARQKMSDFPVNKGIRGLGMSEWDGYGSRLVEKFDFVNTHYHMEPKLDITQYSGVEYSDLDFVICTEVFEHIQRPLDVAFRNLYNLLKPGGSLIFSAPYVDAERTIEHYPDLCNFEILQFKGRQLVLNQTASGAYQVYDKPVFHGGPGTVLEMRVFCERDLVNGLRDAGFADLRVYYTPDLSLGYYWPAVTEFPDRFAGAQRGYVMSSVRPDRY